ncbi:kunitz-type protease inhibitor 2 [Xiphias gladius]|uniref:kunitz-type protease inhibitor 2 n=1 Tax=Xiphias gladius TaxID=8245 RepID=UPI001A99ADC0|nr:kunitz-type protease inhibitor 2 [Xiphias gladius]
MNTHRVRLSLLALCFLVLSGLALDCDWDQSVDPDQGLKPASLVAARHILGRTEGVSDPESCRAACCDELDCDLALVGFPADGGLQCLLMSCPRGDPDICVLEPSSQFKVYRKKVQREARGEKPHVVPLLGSWEPKTNESNSIRCRLPMKVGSCRAAFPRFFYNVTNQSCRSFVYGGCDANANNFDSQEECEATCSGVTGSVLPDESTPAPPEVPAKAPRMAPSFDTMLSEDAEGPVESEPAATESVHPQETGMSADEYAERCEAAPQVGPCRAAFQKWYHNSQTGNCESFIYGGCRGNKNNYVSKESCVATCTVSVLPSPKKSSADDSVSTEYKDQCMATPDPGPCRAAFPEFYYNHKDNTCQSFIYGGCHGNQNRYGTAEECMTRCSRDGSFESRGKTRSRWTAAFFLFATLAAISALLLVTLVLISLKRHRLSRRPLSVSDKEELLSDPEEQSSLESLTVPESPKPNKA